MKPPAPIVNRNSLPVEPTPTDFGMHANRSSSSYSPPKASNSEKHAATPPKAPVPLSNSSLPTNVPSPQGKSPPNSASPKAPRHPHSDEIIHEQERTSAVEKQFIQSPESPNIAQSVPYGGSGVQSFSAFGSSQLVGQEASNIPVSANNCICRRRVHSFVLLAKL